MVMVLTIASGGDEAAAIFHAALGNMIGVILSPALILLYIGAQAEIDVVQVFYELVLRVILPVIIGQVVQRMSVSIVQYVAKHKHFFKQAQQYTLVYIVYTVFCRTFQNKNDDDEEDGSSKGNILDIFLMSKLDQFY
jgi:solute carrier family 10 (sodium/bile acid cotransporter), member 7